MFDSIRRLAPPVLTIVGLIFVLYALVWVGRYLSTQTVSQDIKLPLLAIVGIIGLLASLAFIAVAFAALNLTDNSQALALPEGSVRAVIALCLVVLFAIIAVSLYSSMSEGPIRTISGLSSTDLDTFKKDTTRVQIITITTDSAARSTVVYRQNPGRASEDFAKQLLVMIGTLVTSVASFYFGSRAAAAGVAGPSKKPPSVAAVTPDKLTPGGETELQLTGTNLLLVTDVVAVQGSTQVRATGVTSNDTLVKCKLKLDADAPTGAWDVLATDSDNRSSRLGGAFTVAP